jgi:hypothetical protein
MAAFPEVKFNFGVWQAETRHRFANFPARLLDLLTHDVDASGGGL